jgi:hypothetical protein
MRFLVLALLILSLICGCSRIPEPAGFEYSSQSKMQAAHHWDVLAMDVANQINLELIKDDLLNTAVYVRKTCGEDDAPCKPNETSQFDEGFHDLLVTQLVRNGVPTSTKPEHEILTVNYKVQVVYHHAKRVRTLTPGVLTALTAAVEVLRNASPEVMTVAAAGAIDLANASFVDNGHYEIIVTTSIVSMRKYLFRTSSIYYINDADFWHYQANSGKAKEIKMTSADAPVQRPEKPNTEPNRQLPEPEPKILPKPIRDL